MSMVAVGGYGVSGLKDYRFDVVILHILGF